MVLAATVIALGARAGLYAEASALLFPAATATVMPALNNCTKGQTLKVSCEGHLTAVTALSKAVEAPAIKLMEATLGRPVDGALDLTQSIPEILNTTFRVI
jgi:hypothetical protein